MRQLRSKDKSIEKYIYLVQLKSSEPNLFYKLCVDNMSVSDRENSLRPLVSISL